MHSSSLEWLTEQPRPSTPPRWLATGEKITRAPARALSGSPLFDSPGSPGVVDAKLREKGASLVERRGAPVLSDAVLDALRSAYDTRGHMSAGGQPRWRSVRVTANETRKRLSLSPSTLRQQRRYQPEQEQEQEEATVKSGQRALHWDTPTPEHRVSSHVAPVIQAGRRRGMLQRQGKATRFGIALDDVYENARRNLAEQRATILQLAAAHSDRTDEQHLYAQHAVGSSKAHASDLQHPIAKCKEHGATGASSGVTGNSSATDFLQQVKRRYDVNGGLPFTGGAVPLTLTASTAAVTQGGMGQLDPRSHVQQEWPEQRHSERLRNAADLAATAVRKSHATKLSNHQVEHSRQTKKAPPDAADTISDTNWQVVGWSVFETVLDRDTA